MEATDVYGLVGQDRLDRVERALARRGLTSPRVETHHAAPGRYRLHDETLHRDAASARRGAGLGAACGAVLGLAVALAMPQVTDMASTLGAVAALTGLGALVGGMVGLQRADPIVGDPLTYRDVGGTDHVVVVEVHDEHWHNRAHRILERHGAVFLDGPDPV